MVLVVNKPNKPNCMSKASAVKRLSWMSSFLKLLKKTKKKTELVKRIMVNPRLSIENRTKRKPRSIKRGSLALK